MASDTSSSTGSNKSDDSIKANHKNTDAKVVTSNKRRQSGRQDHGRIKLRGNLQAVKGNLENLKKGNQDYRSRDTFLSEWSKNTPFLRCFDLKTLQIRGVTFFNCQKQPAISEASPKPTG